MEKKLIVSKIDSYRDWKRFIEKNRYNNRKDSEVVSLCICFDLPFLEPFQITSLACLIEEYFQQEICILFEFQNSSVKDYLEDIRFVEYWIEGFDRNKFTNTKKNTALCLWKINETMVDPFAIQAKNYFEQVHFKGKDLDVLYCALGELFNNVFNHSKSAIEGYVFIQFLPNIRKLKLSICDFGIGIPTSVNNYLRSELGEVLSPDEALKKAFEKHFTVQSTPRNRGAGLDTLFSGVVELNGELTFLSNEAYFYKTETESKLGTSKEYIGGTLIDITYDVESWPDSEDLHEDDFYF